MNTIQLHDETSGARAKILVDLGLNCYSFTVPHAGGQLELLWSAPAFAQGSERPSGSGIPILFPFPGRIEGAEFTWNGRPYRLAEGDGRGNAIHGFVYTRPWRVLESSATHLVGHFHASRDDPDILKSWPADFEITATYRLRGTQLQASYEIQNPDQRPLPCGLGVHPYFRVPLGGPSADDCRVQAPVSRQWLLNDAIPTGQCVSPGESEPLAAGMRFAEMQFDTVFGGLKFDDGRCTARVTDPGGRELTISFNEVFRQCVVFNPPHREAVCIEPYTCVPDPIRLTEAGVDAGLRILQPGESLQATLVISS